jgi:hypothetical protein
VGEVRESAPILIKDYWIEGGEDSLVDGSLMTTQFLDAVARASVSKAIYWHPLQDPGILRLSDV